MQYLDFEIERLKKESCMKYEGGVKKNIFVKLSKLALLIPHQSQYLTHSLMEAFQIKKF